MKRLVCILLATVMLPALAACGSSAPADSSAAGTETTAAPANDKLLVGYSAVDITPIEDSMPLAGYGRTMTRMSNGLYEK